MQIWVDADACPKAVKEVLFKVAERRRVSLTLVANSYLQAPNSTFIQTVQVAQGFNVADDHIAGSIQPGDLVITADIPLAAEVIEKGCEVLTPRGDHYTEDNIQSTLAVRNLKEELRSAGMIAGGPPPFGPKEKQNFTNLLDRRLTAMM
ncbi:YaiI/YqxD family protein [Desulfocurvus sp. DL9XJH121]